MTVIDKSDGSGYGYDPVLRSGSEAFGCHHLGNGFGMGIASAYGYTTTAELGDGRSVRSPFGCTPLGYIMRNT